MQTMMSRITRLGLVCAVLAAAVAVWAAPASAHDAYPADPQPPAWWWETVNSSPADTSDDPYCPGRHQQPPLV